MFERKDIYSLEYNLEKSLITESSNWNRNKLSVLSEEEKVSLSDKIITNLFNDIKRKMLKGDYSIIDKTKGDIKKLSNYDTLTTSIKFLKMIADSSKDVNLNKIVTDVESCLKYIESQKSIYTRAYELKNEFLVYMYNSTVLAIIECLSLLVAKAVDFNNVNNFNEIKPEAKKGFVFQSNYLKVVNMYNDMSKKGKVKVISNRLLNKNEAIALDFVLGVAKAVAGVFVVGLNIIRYSVFAFYYSRIKISDHLRHLADFVEGYSNNNKITEKGKKKQEKWIETLNKWADKIDVDNKNSESKSDGDIKNSDNDISQTQNDEIIF